ncbi:phosphoribosylamine--glycine ligase [Cnuella takakiae]|uniref:Phosphoribosylamine--glycine ligase n=1 Tax=Cnuella takakiae TaxID=1302690 RepID=A0A1M5CZ54_9BACT|nr:phosphoribosylamine--glycine ligase [Cnuella takakiae]OLY94159.1 phosphoribosylamine--glycine ligase [Cnuella takakiae]SHF59999.1 phosphoribosylamine--glycine ligase [Cnuella takakiae]
MNILLLGSGGREHALAWKMAQSPLCDQLFIAPGNPGTAQCGTNLSFAATDFAAIKQCCHDKGIGLVVIGPEEPLVKGLVNELKRDASLQHLLIIGPDQHAAQLEGSKAFAKAFMDRHNIPTAAYQEFTADNYEAGVAYIRQQQLPVVLKADGLAAGKGVLICTTHDEAVSEFEQMVRQAKFGAASSKVVVEAFLDGIELSVFALTDGKNYVLLPEAKDYKRIGEGDTGLNTGGMGAVSPVPFADKAFMDKVITKVVKPTIDGLAAEAFDYKGFVFFGLIKVGDEPMVIEYNCRMGDPETEVVMPRLQNDLVELLVAAGKGQLEGIQIQHDPRFATTVMAVSGGYPGDYAKGFVVDGLGENTADSLLFHAGTTTKEGEVVTSGGRVLCVTSFGTTVAEAVAKSRERLEGVSFEGMYYRKDIGYEF